MKTKEENFNLEVRKIINREFYKRGNQSVCESVSDFITDLFNKHSDQQNSDLLKQIDELKKENEMLRDLSEKRLEDYESIYKYFKNKEHQLSESNARVKDVAIGFADWIENDYTKVRGTDSCKWVNHNKYDILINGNDYHRNNLIYRYGKTTPELFDIYLETIK